MIGNKLFNKRTNQFYKIIYKCNDCYLVEYEHGWQGHKNYELANGKKIDLDENKKYWWLDGRLGFIQIIKSELDIE